MKTKKEFLSKTAVSCLEDALKREPSVDPVLNVFLSCVACGL